MMQWFRGRLEGHYVGTSSGAPAVSQFGSADRFKLRVYRAWIRDIEVLHTEQAASDDTPTSDSGAGHTQAEGGGSTPAPSPAPNLAPPATLPAAPPLPDDCFFQAQIDDTRLFGIRPRSCFEGTIYDVAISDLKITHSTKKGGKTYGRLEGEIYARYLLPADVDAKTAEELALELSNMDPGVAAGAEQALEHSDKSASAVEGAAASQKEALHPPSPARENQPQEPAKVPLALLIAVMAIVLGLAGGSTPALLWLGVFTPIMVIRLILGGLFKVTNAQRVFGAILVLIQFACLGMLMLDWWAASCKLINPWAVSGIGVAALIASVLPSPIPLLYAGGSLALVLFLWYSDVGTRCEQPAPTVERPSERPSVDDPGVPRTNEDGSWPRRPPRRTRP